VGKCRHPDSQSRLEPAASLPAELNRSQEGKFGKVERHSSILSASGRRPRCQTDRELSGVLVVFHYLPARNGWAGHPDMLLWRTVLRVCKHPPGLTSIYRWEGKLCKDAEVC